MPGFRLVICWTIATLGIMFLASFPPAAMAQRGPRGPAPLPLSPEERHAVIEQIARQLTEHYVFPEVAQKTGAALAANEKGGAYAALSDPFAFADALTRDLREVAHDLHLRVGVKPPQAPGAAPEERAAAGQRAARAENYGFREVRLLPGNIGYLRLDGFVPADLGGRTAVAAMSFLSGADAIIFDLRNNGGGSPTMIQLLSSYLFSEPTHLNDLYYREGDRRDQFWTLPWVDGERRPDVPVYVLTSTRTFSAAEEFTNNLKVLKRATIVGETTGGGANPGESYDAGEHFVINVPTGRAINPTTGTNWEGTGVEPDVKVPAAEALLAAQAAALDTLAAKAKAPEEAARYGFARLKVEGQLHPYTLPADRVADYAGAFGPRRVTPEAGGLSYQREGGPKLRMAAVAQDLFALEGVDDALVRAERDAAGRVVKLVVLYDNGESNESPRTP
jgi:hypothetical protein